MRYEYSARVLPIGTPVVIPDLMTGDRSPVTFTADDFSIERGSRNVCRVLLNHDLLKPVGNVFNLWRHDGWFRADFTLDEGLTAVLSVGQPVSACLVTNKWGSTFLSEVSLVRRGAVKGAEIISRVELAPKAKPAAAAAIPSSGRRPQPDWSPQERARRDALMAKGIIVRTKRGERIDYVRGDIIVHRLDGTQDIYCGEEGRAEAIRDGVLVQ